MIVVICPHCTRTIREEQRYLMAREQDGEIPGWLITAAVTAACFVAIIGVLTAAAG